MEPRDPGPAITRPSGQPDPSAKPSGEPKKISRNEKKPENIRALNKENESAEILARAGYKLKQRPESTPPDYDIEGRLFDCIAPTVADAAKLRGKIKDKVVDKGQDRLILNLDGNTVSHDALFDQLQSNKIEGLKEIIILQDGKVIPFWPR